MAVISNKQQGEDNTKQMSANDRATQNNANNIKNVAEVAKHSANPYAKAAGHAVSAADKLTGGKASQKLGSAMTKANKMAPGGRRLQNASNKLSESGASDKIGKAASMKNGAKGASGVQKGDVGENRLKNSLANRGNNNRRNLLNAKNNNESSSSQSTQSSTPSTSDSQEPGKEKVAAFVKKKIILMLLPIVGFIFMFIIIILLIVSLVSAVFPFLVPKESKDELKEVQQTIYQEGTDLHQDEVDYYAKLDEVGEEFKEKCENEELNLTMIHSILSYLYYDSDKSDEIEYNKMKNMVDTIIDDLPEECGVDYSIGGDFFNNLKNDEKIESYYKPLLRSDRKVEDVLTDAFNFAGEVEDMDESGNQSTMPDELGVSDIVENQSVPVKDYIAGVLYANLDNNILTNTEKVKAYTIALTTNIMAKNNISINTQTISANTLSEYLYCNPDNCSGKGSVSDIVKNNVTNAVNSVYGNIVVDKTGEYKSVSLDRINSASGNDYKTILTNAYDGYTLKEVREDSYANGVNFGYEKILTPITFYAQYDYLNQFCGVRGATIFYYGCGTTSMAMIASTYANDKKYDPVYMMNEAHKAGYCGSSGTNAGFFRYEAAALGYKYMRVGKYSKNDLNILTSHLKKGHLAIVHVLAGHFTNGGHYMVLGGIDPETKKVYVYDPYDRENKKNYRTGSGWYSLNDMIAKEAYAFYIIWKE